MTVAGQRNAVGWITGIPRIVPDNRQISGGYYADNAGMPYSIRVLAFFCRRKTGENKLITGIYHVKPGISTGNR